MLTRSMMISNNIEFVISPIRGVDYFRDDWLYIVSTMDDVNMSGDNVLVLNYMDVGARGVFRFSEEHAKRVVQFIIERSGTFNTIVCMCSEGVSRSPGLAAALMEAYDQDSSSIWNDNDYRPNEHVYSVMKRAIKEKLCLSLERGAYMKKYNMTIVYDKALEKVLFCVRKKDPYKNKLNLIGGKIEEGEATLEAAYRELEEETGIRKEQVTPLTHLIDFVYYDSNRFIEFYVTRLAVDNVVLVPELDGNDLKWINLDGTDFGNTSIFAGDGNILHCVMMANKYWRKNNVENRE